MVWIILGAVMRILTERQVINIFQKEKEVAQI